MGKLPSTFHGMRIMAGFWTTMKTGLFGAKTDEPSQSENPTNGAPAPSASIGGEALAGLLVTLGYTPEPLRRPDGSALGYRMQATVGDWTTTVHLFLGARLNTVSVMVTLRAIEDPDVLPAVYYRRLLTANDLVAPGYFFYSHDLARLFLVERFPNLDVTAELLRKRMDDLFQLAYRTAEYWNPA